MRNIYSLPRKQRGFSMLTVILLIVAIVAGLSVWAMSGTSNISNAASNSPDVLASSLVNDAAAIDTSFANLLVQGNAASSITFIPATAGSTNMLDPTTGLQYPLVNPAVVVNNTWTNGAWIYMPTGFVGNNIGTSAADNAIVVLGVKDTVCARINNRLYGSTTIPASLLVTSAMTTGATAAAPTVTTGAADIHAVAGVAGWMSGCMTTTSGANNNFYFHILQPN